MQLNVTSGNKDQVSNEVTTTNRNIAETSRALDFSSPIFLVARLDFPSPQLSAPGSPRMHLHWPDEKSSIDLIAVFAI